jgi:hypothetical protein
VGAVRSLGLVLIQSTGANKVLLLLLVVVVVLVVVVPIMQSGRIANKIAIWAVVSYKGAL